MFSNMFSNGLTDIVISGTKDYNGWLCTYAGDGCIVMEKNCKKISAHRSRFDNCDYWLNDVWKECKSKIDAIEH